MPLIYPGLCTSGCVRGSRGGRCQRELFISGLKKMFVVKKIVSTIYLSDQSCDSLKPEKEQLQLPKEIWLF